MTGQRPGEQILEALEALEKMPGERVAQVIEVERTLKEPQLRDGKQEAAVPELPLREGA